MYGEFRNDSIVSHNYSYGSAQQKIEKRENIQFVVDLLPKVASNKFYNGGGKQQKK